MTFRNKIIALSFHTRVQSKGTQQTCFRLVALLLFTCCFLVLRSLWLEGNLDIPWGISTVCMKIQQISLRIGYTIQKCTVHSITHCSIVFFKAYTHTNNYTESFLLHSKLLIQWQAAYRPTSSCSFRIVFLHWNVNLWPCTIYLCALILNTILHMHV